MYPEPWTEVIGTVVAVGQSSVLIECVYRVGIPIEKLDDFNNVIGKSVSILKTDDDLRIQVLDKAE